MTRFLGIVAVAAFAALLVSGLWLPQLWIGAGVILAWFLLYAVGLTQARDAPDELERRSPSPHRFQGRSPSLRR